MKNTGGMKITSNELQSRHVEGKWMSKTQASKLVKPDHEDELIEKTLTEIPPIRTARISVSEKAMCPRECDQVRKVANRLAKNNYLTPGAAASFPNGLLSRKRKLSMDRFTEQLYKKSAQNLIETAKFISAVQQPISPTLNASPGPHPALLAKQISVYPLNGHLNFRLANQSALPKFQPQPHSALEQFDRRRQIVMPTFPYPPLDSSYHHHQQQHHQVQASFGQKTVSRKNSSNIM
mmetsp:Transcript_17420/g.21447  ORF Transcript_17420/g.21447 Transcript_17420/m.21447 type:complete len:236 (-) Transcript_17420:704-1411(-)